MINFIAKYKKINKLIFVAVLTMLVSNNMISMEYNSINIQKNHDYTNNNKNLEEHKSSISMIIDSKETEILESDNIFYNSKKRSYVAANNAKVNSPNKKHKENYAGEKSYECDYQNCGRKFSERGNLKVHKRTHTRERPYPCNSCGKEFAPVVL